MELLGKVVDAVLPAFINTVVENVAYPFKASNNVKALDLATGQLIATEADVKNRVQNAELQGLTQTNRVGEWLGRVEAAKAEVDEIKRRYEGRPRCLGGRSFNFCFNYSIGKGAVRKLQEVQDLNQNGQFQEVAVQLPPWVEGFPVSSTAVVPKEEAGLQKILRYIDNDHDDIIGIWGMGGVGKTRLLHLVHDSYKQNTAFEVVIYITASQECSIEKLQAELCEKYPFGRGRSVESQAQIISNYLGKHSFLLLLDDLWDAIDLQRVGIPFPLGMVGQHKRKVVITTRKLAVCGLMEARQAHKVDCLDTDNALCLFNEKVGDETIGSHPQIPSLARRVVNELDGLPLALITIGRAMYGKKDPREWEDAIDLLQKSRLNEIETIPNEDKIYYRLKFSYDSLETKELRDCFLACALWPEDYGIKKKKLIQCWMGLGILPVFDARNIYYPGYTIIGKLFSACLLEDAGSDRVKMHDVIRDMALWLVGDFGEKRDKWIVRTSVGVDQVLQEKDRWYKTEWVTLLGAGKKPISIPHQANNLHFLKTNSQPNNLESFCSLTYLELSLSGLHNFPLAIPNLVSLRYLDLSNNYISYVPVELKLLINMKYLFLNNNDIASFPEGIIPELRELHVLDLFSRERVQSEHQTWLIKELKCLDNIRSLGIRVHRVTQFKSLLELPNLPIKSLSFKMIEEIDFLLIPSSFIGNSQVQDTLGLLTLNGKRVKKVVIESDSQNLHCCLKNLERIDFFRMEILEEIIWKNVTPRDLFLALSFLRIRKCGKLRDVSWTLYLPCLKELVIVSCHNMVELINHSELPNATEERAEMVTPTFPSLTKLDLWMLPKLQIICDPSIIFPSLEEIHIIRCPMVVMLPFQSNMVPRKLTSIRAEKTWWEQLEWKDNDLKMVLEHLFKEW